MNKTELSSKNKTKDIEESKDTSPVIQSKNDMENSWVDEIILEQEEDLYEEDSLMNIIPRNLAEQYRDEE